MCFEQHLRQSAFEIILKRGLKLTFHTFRRLRGLYLWRCADDTDLAYAGWIIGGVFFGSAASLRPGEVIKSFFWCWCSTKFAAYFPINSPIHWRSGSTGSHLLRANVLGSDCYELLLSASSSFGLASVIKHINSGVNLGAKWSKTIPRHLLTWKIDFFLLNMLFLKTRRFESCRRPQFGVQRCMSLSNPSIGCVSSHNFGLQSRTRTQRDPLYPYQARARLWLLLVINGSLLFLYKDLHLPMSWNDLLRGLFRSTSCNRNRLYLGCQTQLWEPGPLLRRHWWGCGASLLLGHPITSSINKYTSMELTYDNDILNSTLGDLHKFETRHLQCITIGVFLSCLQTKSTRMHIAVAKAQITVQLVICLLDLQHRINSFVTPTLKLATPFYIMTSSLVLGPSSSASSVPRQWHISHSKYASSPSSAFRDPCRALLFYASRR